MVHPVCFTVLYFTSGGRHCHNKHSSVYTSMFYVATLGNHGTFRSSTVHTDLLSVVVVLLEVGGRLLKGNSTHFILFFSESVQM